MLRVAFASRLVLPVAAFAFLACGSDDPETESPETVDARGVWVGASDDGRFAAAVVTDEVGTLAYLCDGAAADHWFVDSGAAADTAGALTVHAAGDTLAVSVAGDTMTGTATGVDGDTVSFTAARATGEAALHRFEAYEEGETDDAGVVAPVRRLTGWIVDADGDVKGTSSATPGDKTAATSSPPAGTQVAGTYSCALPPLPIAPDVAELPPAKTLKPPTACVQLPLTAADPPKAVEETKFSNATLPPWLDKAKLEAAYLMADAAAEKVAKPSTSKYPKITLKSGTIAAYRSADVIALAKKLVEADRNKKPTGSLIAQIDGKLKPFQFDPGTLDLSPKIEFIPPRPPLPEPMPQPTDFVLAKPFSTKSSYRTEGDHTEAEPFVNDVGTFFDVGSTGFDSRVFLKRQFSAPFELQAGTSAATVELTTAIHMDGSLASPLPVGVGTLTTDVYIAIMDVATNETLDVEVQLGVHFSSPFPTPGTYTPATTLVPARWILGFDVPLNSRQFLVVVSIKSDLRTQGATQGWFQQSGGITEIRVRRE